MGPPPNPLPNPAPFLLPFEAVLQCSRPGYGPRSWKPGSQGLGAREPGPRGPGSLGPGVLGSSCSLVVIVKGHHRTVPHRLGPARTARMTSESIDFYDSYSVFAHSGAELTQESSSRRGAVRVFMFVACFRPRFLKLFSKKQLTILITMCMVLDGC